VAPFLPRTGAVAFRAEPRTWRLLLRDPVLLRLHLFTLAAYVFLQGPTALFPIYVRSQGGDMDTVGRMWTLMLLPEIPLVALAGAGLRRIGARGLLAVGVIAGGLRWFLCGVTGDPRVVYPVQLLHGVVVTGITLGGPMYLEAFVPERLRSTGQALLSTIGFGCGGIVSNAATGWLFEHAGPRAPYFVGGAGALLLGFAVPWLLPASQPTRAQPEADATSTPLGGLPQSPDIP
jgi:hypothetical protein